MADKLPGLHIETEFLIRYTILNTFFTFVKGIVSRDGG
jgi:hypothetical protein